jgi:3'(2'), 5'-bisphosphate nucleotidase
LKLDSLLPQILSVSERAGAAILEVYGQKDFGTTYKENHSPLTRADMAAHHLIVSELSKIEPRLPVLSEESKDVPYEERRGWTRFWLVDPLDGTKEFIKRNDEFTVNIALIDGSAPVLGVLHAPALGETYYAVKGSGAFKRMDGKESPIRVLGYAGGTLKVAGSRSHGKETLEAFLSRVGPTECINVGSALKFGRIAEGAAHIYPRWGTTMEWDTAAGQCVVEAAGGTVTDLSGRPLRYNKPDLRNPNFIACGAPAFPWEKYI